KSLAREFQLGGVVLFARNVQAPEQVAELVHGLRQLGDDEPPWVAVDQEGGRVARLRKPFTEWPPMATLGRLADPRVAERFARALADELLAVGISLDFAPVLDVHTNPKNPVIGDRALGEKPEVVAEHGVAIIRGLQDAGVAACGKHFPGHGDTSTDSHLTLPLVEHPPDRLRAVEFAPFRAAIAADVASIMTAHVLVPALDEQRPASLSRRIVRDILREELGFQGLIISDDLEMRAVADGYALEESSVLAIEAGCDVVLLCGTDHNKQARALEALVRAVESERLLFKQVDETLARHRRVRERFGARWSRWRPPSAQALRAALGTDEHQAIAEHMRRFV
ncbi:MAG: beta-N-acetylhexosaminidase, partial [Bacteroidales bacterium]